MFPDLDNTPERPEDSKQDEKHDDPRIGPVVLGPAPLEREQDRYDGRYEDEYADRVHPLDLAQLAGFGLDSRFRVLEEDGDEDARDGAEGKIDIEAPSPTDPVS